MDGFPLAKTEGCPPDGEDRAATAGYLVIGSDVDTIRDETDANCQRTVNPSEGVDSAVMEENVETLANLSRGQFVRLTLEDGTELVARSNQFDIDPDRSLRIELTSDESGDRTRYQLRSSADGGEWTPVELREYDPVGVDDDWIVRGIVVAVEPMEDHRMLDSEIDTGSEG